MRPRVPAAEAAPAAPVPRARPSQTWCCFVTSALPSKPGDGLSQPLLGLWSGARRREEPPGPVAASETSEAGWGSMVSLGQRVVRRERYLRGGGEGWLFAGLHCVSGNVELGALFSALQTVVGFIQFFCCCFCFLGFSFGSWTLGMRRAKAWRVAEIALFNSCRWRE